MNASSSVPDVPPVDAVAPSICIDDPVMLYLVVCCINTLAYVCASVTYNYRKIHDFLVSLNIAVAFNLFLAVHASPGVAISYGVICVVTLLMYAFYHLFLALGLLSTASVIIGLNFFNVKQVAQRWLSTILGVDVSETAVDIVFLSTSLLLLVLYFTVSDAPVVKAIADGALFSFLMTYAVRYFRFQAMQNRDGSASRICCDDVDVPCPVWLGTPYLFLFVYLMFTRLLLHCVWTRHLKQREVERRLHAPLARVAADFSDEDGDAGDENDDSEHRRDKKAGIRRIGAAVGTIASHDVSVHAEHVPLLVRPERK